MSCLSAIHYKLYGTFLYSQKALQYPKGSYPLQILLSQFFDVQDNQNSFISFHLSKIKGIYNLMLL